MGYEIAEACARQGAKVIVVSGPVIVTPVNSNISVVRVQTAKQMFEECHSRFSECDIAIFTAAVADFTPEMTSREKVKRGKVNWQINLVPTTDIAEKLGAGKKKGQITAGFALETENELENARIKIKKKNFDFIVLNSLRDKGAGFGTETNRITIIDKNNNIDKFELKSKSEVANDIVDKLISMLP